MFIAARVPEPLIKQGLKAGDWVTTGSTMGICPAPPGSAAIADFGSLGRIEVSFTA